MNAIFNPFMHACTDEQQREFLFLGNDIDLMPRRHVFDLVCSLDSRMPPLHPALSSAALNRTLSTLAPRLHSHPDILPLLGRAGADMLELMKRATSMSVVEEEM